MVDLKKIQSQAHSLLEIVKYGECRYEYAQCSVPGISDCI